MAPGRSRWTGRALCCACALLALAPATASALDRYVYVSEGFPAGNQELTVFKIGAKGSLSTVGANVPTGGTVTEGLSITPNAKHLYVATFGTGDVRGYNINPDTGGLSFVGAFPTGSTPLGTVPDPNGSHLFVWNHGNAIGVWTINDATGTLAQIGGSPFALPATETNPFAGSVAPNGGHLYVPFENTVPGAGAPDKSGVYQVAANGALTLQQQVTTGGGAAADGNPFGSGITPDGRFLYISAPEDLASVGDIYGFSVNPDGSLTALPGSPYPVTPGGGHPLTLAVAPDGKHVYVATRATSVVKGYTINANGSLTSIGAFATGGTNGKSLAITPDGRHLYVSNNGSNNVSGFNILANGTLSLLANSPFPTGSTGNPDLESIAITPNQPPTASFTAQANFAGRPTGFDATGSTDTDGNVRTYDWDFGDGTILPDGGALPTHIYSTPGSFTATLTVTDNEGCSAGRIFTGKATLCNGSTVATTTRTFTVGAAPTTPAPGDVSRTLSISYKAKKGLFKGTLSSGNEDCNADQKVVVFRKRPGPDPVVKSDLTDATAAGTEAWSAKKKNAKGKFYATVAQSILPDDTLCLPATSKTTKKLK